MITRTIDLSGVVMPYSVPPLPTNVSGKSGTIYVINMSDICWSLYFGKDTSNFATAAHVPSWWARPFCIPSTVDALSFVSTQMPPGYVEPAFNHLAVETYLAGEDTSKLTDTPISIQQGPTSSKLTTAQQLQNDGNSIQQWIEATPIGAPSSVYSLNTDGTGFIGILVGGVVVKWLQLANTAPLVDITASQILGPASSNLNIVAGASGLMFLQDSVGSNQLEISSNGPALKQGPLNLLAGHFDRMNGARITCGSGTVISHGLGVTPTMSIGCPDIAQPGSATVGTGSNNSSTFTASVGAGSSIGWLAAAGF